MSETKNCSTGIDRLAGPGGVRPLVARWVITAEAVLESAAHFGGQGDELTDMPVIRDARDGTPLLPGTSLAGALRGCLADYLAGYGSPEPAEVSWLFGGSRGDDLGAQSPLIVFDSLGQLPPHRSSEIRDGVSIDATTGTADEHKKFDFEVLPPGTVFPLRLELLLENTAQECQLIGLLAACLQALEVGELTIGMRRSRGLGRFSARNWRAYRYDLSSSPGWLEWLLSDHDHPIPAGKAPQSDLGSALRNAHRGAQWQIFEDRRKRLICDLFLKQQGGVLVRSPGLTPDAPDVAHLTSGGQPILPGTGLAGALRTRAIRIARIVRDRHHDAEHWVKGLFGPRTKGEDGTEASLWSSRIRISESRLRNGKPLRPSRVRIDRFTQGVVPAALFDEEPWFGGETCMRLELRNPEEGEIGLLLLLVKDLLTGDLPVGGTASVGRGVFTGRATLRFPDGFVADLEAGAALPDATVQRLDKAIRSFHDIPPRNHTQEMIYA
jgi:CRISPR/Cas system CSM-associated protein Csm3 (group 7 of RAMP superfamily)